jgi:hypothetical protein
MLVLVIYMVAKETWPETANRIPMPEWAVAATVLALAVGIGAWTLQGEVDTLGGRIAVVTAYVIVAGPGLILFGLWFMGTVFNVWP